MRNEAVAAVKAVIAIGLFIRAGQIIPRWFSSGWLVAFAPIIGSTPRSATPSQLGQRIRSSLATVPLR